MGIITVVLTIVVTVIGLLIITSPIWIVVLCVMGWRVGSRAGEDLRHWVEKK